MTKSLKDLEDESGSGGRNADTIEIGKNEAESTEH